MEAASLRNRLAVAAGMWREATTDPLPKLQEADPATQISEFELRLVDLLCRSATADTAREIAEKTWDLVHDRPDSDRVKQRVTECHEELARLSRGAG
jgi:hypothetical protein